jgi:hypothetical protein
VNLGVECFSDTGQAAEAIELAADLTVSEGNKKVKVIYGKHRRKSHLPMFEEVRRRSQKKLEEKKSHIKLEEGGCIRHQQIEPVVLLCMRGVSVVW